MRLPRGGPGLYRDDAGQLPLAAAERAAHRQGNRGRVQHRAAAGSDPRRIDPHPVSARAVAAAHQWMGGIKWSTSPTAPPSTDSAVVLDWPKETLRPGSIDGTHG